jgi:hypothetical protein
MKVEQINRPGSWRQFGISTVLIVTTLAAITVSAALYFERSPKLTKIEVLQMADEFAELILSKYGSFDTNNYPNRNAKFDWESKSWYIFYEKDGRQTPGDHFSITIHDETNEIEFMGGM